MWTFIVAMILLYVTVTMVRLVRLVFRGIQSVAEHGFDAYNRERALEQALDPRIHRHSIYGLASVCVEQEAEGPVLVRRGRCRCGKWIEERQRVI